jgi:hypothetical protein
LVQTDTKNGACQNNNWQLTWYRWIILVTLHKWLNARQQKAVLLSNKTALADLTMPAKTGSS